MSLYRRMMHEVLFDAVEEATKRSRIAPPMPAVSTVLIMLCSQNINKF